MFQLSNVLAFKNGLSQTCRNKVVESQDAQTTKIGRTFTLLTLRRLGASVWCHFECSALGTKEEASRCRPFNSSLGGVSVSFTFVV